MLYFDKILNIIHKWWGRVIWVPYHKLRHNSIGSHSYMLGGTFLRDCKIGKYCYVGKSALHSTDLGNYCSIASGVYIGGMEHSHWALSTSTHLSDECISDRRTIIEDDVWIGAGAIIRQGVHIGRGAVVGANSVVTKDVASYAIVFGTPAKLHKYRFDQDIRDMLDRSEYWKFPPAEAKKILSGIDVKRKEAAK